VVAATEVASLPKALRQPPCTDLLLWFQMTTQHPITPPPELVEQWATASPVQSNDENWAYELFIAHRAAQWGADQELEACCELMDDWGLEASDLHAARRPKPPSLKEQALAVLTQYMTGETILTNDSVDTIRRALEALDD